MHEVNIAHIMEGDCFIFYFFPKRSDLSCVHNEETPVTLKMNFLNVVKIIHHYQIGIHTLFIIIFHNYIGKDETWA